LNPPEKSIRNLIYNNYDISEPAKASVNFPEIMRLDEFKKIADRGKNMIWVEAEEAPMKPSTFTHMRVDQRCVVHILTKAASGTNTDVLAANTRKQNMIDEVCQIILANGPTGAITEFIPRIAHLIDRSDIFMDPPLLAADVVVKCVYLR